MTAKLTNKHILELLSAVPLFAECTKTDLRSVIRHGERLEAKAGEDLVVQGSPGSAFFLLLDGTARVKRNARKVAELGAGDFFGELSLLDPAPRNATVTATTDVVLLALTERMFKVALRDLPRLRRGLLTAMSLRLRELDLVH